MSYNVINNPVGAADITVADGKVTITGAPTMEYLKIGNCSEDPSYAATPYVATVTLSSAANNTAYSIGIFQNIATLPNGFLQKNITALSDGSATTTEVINDLVLKVNNSGFQITAVATSATVMTLTANAGYELFQLTNTCTAANFTVASGMATIAPNATPATAIAGTTTVTVTTLAAHGLVVGDIVSITDVATMVLTGGLGNNLYRVDTVPTATTFTLYRTTAAGANSGTIVITQVASYAYNDYTALTAAGIEGVTSGVTYTAFNIPFGGTITPLFNTLRNQDLLHTVYVSETDSDYATTRTAFRNALSGLAGGVANPEAISHLF